MEPCYGVNPALNPESSCFWCGKRNYLGYHYTCHLCGASYCYVHMQRHAGAHPRGVRVQAGGLDVPVGDVPRFDILTDDPEEVKLIQRFVFNLLGPMGRPRPLEGMQPSDP